LVALLVGWQAGWAPVLAQTITGTPGAAAATTTIRGNQLPASAPAFGGVIKNAALQTRHWCALRIVPPQQAPNVLLIITDDAGFGVPSTCGGMFPTPAMDRLAKNGLP
jgi:arylsulfatase